MSKANRKGVGDIRNVTQEAEIPVCCWNCRRSMNDWFDPSQSGWNCNLKNERQMTRGLNDCPDFICF